jgi:hypothetical protein
MYLKILLGPDMDHFEQMVHNYIVLVKESLRTDKNLEALMLRFHNVEHMTTAVASLKEEDGTIKYLVKSTPYGDKVF